MLKVQRARTILQLALPIMGGMVSQNILNLVDIFFVKSLGDSALAAAGIGGFASFVSISLILGVSTGVQALSARRLGEGRSDEMASPLNSGLLIAFVAGLALSILVYQLVPIFYPFLNDDPEVQVLGSSYLQVRMFGLVFLGLNFSFRGYWNGVNLSRYYMKTLIVMHVINALMNYMLIFGNWGAPELGLDGAAWGTNISLACGTMIYLVLGYVQARPHGFLSCLPTRQEVWALIKLSLPSGIQQLFFSGGLLAFYWIVGMIGTSQLAAANILTNVMLVAILPAMGLGLAAASLVGQALGRKDQEDAAAWGWDVAKLGSMIIGILALPMVFSPGLVLLPFAPSEEVLAIARLPLMITGVYIALDACGMVLMYSHLGAGATSFVMKVSLAMQWLCFIPLATVLVHTTDVNFTAVWVMQGGYRLLQGIVFARSWHRGGWAAIKI